MKKGFILFLLFTGTYCFTNMYGYTYTIRNNTSDSIGYTLVYQSIGSLCKDHEIGYIEPKGHVDIYSKACCTRGLEVWQLGGDWHYAVTGFRDPGGSHYHCGGITFDINPPANEKDESSPYIIQES